MYGNFNPQITRDRIDQQIAQLQQMKEQITQPLQPTSLTQNFQLAPSNQGAMRYANSIEDVRKEVVYTDTPYFSKDMSVVWIKNLKGDITPYELKKMEIKDEKDLKIEYLQAQINELKGRIKDEPITDDIKPSKDEKSSSVSTSTKSNKK